MPCPLLVGGRTLPMLEVKPPERPSSRCRDPPREEEREKKKKKHKKRSRTRSRSPKYHSSSKPRSRSHSKAKHSLPSAYRTVRRSRWVCRHSYPPAPGLPCMLSLLLAPCRASRRFKVSTGYTRLMNTLGWGGVCLK